jgi:hypothetical protein
VAEQILIEFASRTLEQAKSITKDILASLREAGKQIKDVGARKDFLAFVKEKTAERREEIKLGERQEANRRAQVERVASNLGQIQPLIDKSVASALQKTLGFGARLGHLGGGLVNVLTQDDPRGTKGMQLALHAAAASNIPVVSQTAAILSQVVALMDAQDEKRFARLEKEFQERIKQNLEAADQTKKFQNDPLYRAFIEQQAQSRYLSNVAGGWEPRSSRLLDGDF